VVSVCFVLICFVVVLVGFCVRFSFCAVVCGVGLVLFGVF